jgi:hypothetical protein
MLKLNYNPTDLVFRKEAEIRKQVLAQKELRYY